MMIETKKNEKYLPNIVLPSDLKIVDSMEEATKDVDAVVLVVPAKAIRETCKKNFSHIFMTTFSLFMVRKGLNQFHIREFLKLLKKN